MTEWRRPPTMWSSAARPEHPRSRRRRRARSRLRAVVRSKPLCFEHDTRSCEVRNIDSFTRSAEIINRRKTRSSKYEYSFIPTEKILLPDRSANDLLKMQILHLGAKPPINRRLYNNKIKPNLRAPDGRAEHSRIQ